MTIAYWMVVVTAVLPWLYASYAKLAGGFQGQDNQLPRNFLNNLTGKAQRAHAAQQNSYEIFPVFAAAVIISSVIGKINPSVLDQIAILFVLSRVLYFFCYIYNKASWRSLVWFLGVVCMALLFILSI